MIFWFEFKDQRYVFAAVVVQILLNYVLFDYHLLLLFILLSGGGTNSHNPASVHYVYFYWSRLKMKS